MLLLVIMCSLVSPNFKFVFNLQGIVDVLLHGSIESRAKLHATHLLCRSVFP